MKQDRLDCIIDPTITNHPSLAAMLGLVLLCLIAAIIIDHVCDSNNIKI